MMGQGRANCSSLSSNIVKILLGIVPDRAEDDQHARDEHLERADRALGEQDHEAEEGDHDATHQGRAAQVASHP